VFAQARPLGPTACVGQTVKLTGITFDFPHGQPVVAKNTVELHLVFEFKVSNA
jgi:hypothetical protein